MKPTEPEGGTAPSPYQKFWAGAWELGFATQTAPGEDTSPSPEGNRGVQYYIMFGVVIKI